MNDNLKAGLALGGAGMAGLALGGAMGYYAGKRSSKKKKKSKSSSRKSHSKRRKGKQRKPYTAGKRRDTSTRRIRYTKNNQPYIILRSGKARFIKKSSVRNSRKRTGGKY